MHQARRPIFLYGAKVGGREEFSGDLRDMEPARDLNRVCPVQS